MNTPSNVAVCFSPCAVCLVAAIAAFQHSKHVSSLTIWVHPFMNYFHRMIALTAFYFARPLAIVFFEIGNPSLQISKLLRELKDRFQYWDFIKELHYV